MKNTFFLVPFFFITSCVVAQQQQQQQAPRNNIVCKSTAKGMFVQFIGKDIMGHSLELFRKESSESSYKKIATISALSSKAELEQRIASAKTIFEAGASPTTEGIDAVWETYQHHPDTLNAFIIEVPQLAYVFNIAYMDTDLKVNQRYQYQLQDQQKVIATSDWMNYTKRYVFPNLKGMQDTLSGNAITFRMQWTKEFNHYVSVEAKRKLFTQKPSQYSAVVLNVATRKIGKVAYTTLTDYTLPGISEYDYQLRLRNVFGEYDTANYFYSASNVNYQQRPKITSLKVRSDQQTRAFRVSWELSNPQLVQTVRLYRSDKMEGEFKKIGDFNPLDTLTLDPIQVANELYFYYIEVTDIFNQKTNSIKIHEVYEGSHVPSPPFDLAVNGLAGNVQLTWKASDPYTRGFYVYRKQGLTGEYRQVSAFIPAAKGNGLFKDSTTLDASQSYYYAVSAESDTYQKSKYTEPVSFRPQTSASTLKPPLDVNAVFRNEKVKLTWENKNLTDPEIMGYHIYRKRKSDVEFAPLTEEPVLLNYFIDSTLLANEVYEYTVTSVNGTGAQSKNALPVTMDLVGKFQMTPERLGYELITSGIKLKWTSLDVKRIQFIEIYRAIENENFKLLTNMGAENSSYTDKAVQKGKLYSYRLVTKAKGGTESEPTRAILINY